MLTALIHVDAGVPVSAAVGDCSCPVPHRPGEPGLAILCALLTIGFAPYGRLEPVPDSDDLRVRVQWSSDGWVRHVRERTPA